MNTAGLKTKGEALRDAGIDRAAKRRPHCVARGELAFLDALLKPDAIATTDVIADDLWQAYGDGGKWVGSIPAKLLKYGIVTEVGVTRSLRPSRHRGLTRVYKIADLGKARNRRDILRRQLAEIEARQLKSGSPLLTTSATQL